MSHHIRELLSAYIDEVSTAEEKTRVERHLTECADCRQALEEMKGMLNWMKRVPRPEARAGLATRLNARLESPSRKKWLWPFTLGSAAGVMATLLVFVLVSDMQKDEARYRHRFPHKKWGVNGESSDRKQSRRERRQAQRALAQPVQELESNDDAAEDLQTQLTDAEPAAGVPAGPKELDAVAIPAAPLGSSSLYGDSRREAKSNKLARSAEAEAPAAAMKKENSVVLEYAGIMSGITEPREVIVRSQPEWTSLLSEMVDKSPGKAFVEVDFSRQMIAAVFRGESGPRDRIRIVSAEEKKNPKGRYLLIHFQKTKLSEDVMAAAVQTQPFYMKVLPRFDGPVVFEEKK